MIPVSVVDDHNDALDHYYKLFARNKIPLQENALLHFDSHPDLATPEEIPVSKFKSRHELLDNLTISDWILPAVYSGHFDTVIWIKPPWAKQIDEGTFTLEIGEDETGHLKTTSDLPYFTSDLCYRNQLNNSRKFQLHVFEITFDKSQYSKNRKVFEALSEILKNKVYCLDIDMDFYSTTNPFMELLDNHFEFIDELFRFQEKHSLTETLNYRNDQLNCLKELCDDDKSNLTSSNFLSECKKKYPNLSELISEVKSTVKDDEYITDLYYIGQQTELPHHISSVEEIDSLLHQTHALLSTIRSGGECGVNPPVAITMARSEYDEYSSKDTLDYVHRRLVQILKDIYPISSSLVCPES